MEKKDFSKLRPFDLEAARDRGEAAIIVERDEEFSFVAGPNNLQEYVLCGNESGFIVVGESLDHATTVSSLRTAPLAWVRASADDDTLWPVYKGDVLYSSFFKSTFEVTGVDGDGQFKAEKYKAEKYATLAATRFESCTFIPPKMKRGGLYAVFETAPGAFEVRGPFKDNIEAENARSIGVSLVATFVREWNEPA